MAKLTQFQYTEFEEPQFIAGISSPVHGSASFRVSGGEEFHGVLVAMKAAIPFACRSWDEDRFRVWVTAQIRDALCGLFENGRSCFERAEREGRDN